MIAYDLCREVLSQLGENIPETVYSNQMTRMTEATAQMVEGISDTDLLEMKEMDTKLATLMGFYSVMWRAAFLAKPEMVPFLACQVVQHTMKNGICKHSISGLIVLAALLCSNTMLEVDIQSALKIGKAAMSCFTQRYNTSEELPAIYSLYYGYVAWHNEPLQICAEKLLQGFEVGMSLGESLWAFFNSIHHVMMAIIAGERLPTLLEKMDYYLQKAETHKNEMGKMMFSNYRHTIEILIGGGESWLMDIKLLCLALLPAKILVNLYFYSALKTYWQGHYKRCQHYVDKMLAVISTSSIDLQTANSTYIMFINGLNSLELMKIKYNRRLKPRSVRALKLLKKASEHSSWNFQNKVRYYLHPVDDPFLFLYLALHV